MNYLVMNRDSTDVNEEIVESNDETVKSQAISTRELGKQIREQTMTVKEQMEKADAIYPLTYDHLVCFLVRTQSKSNVIPIALSMTTDQPAFIIMLKDVITLIKAKALRHRVARIIQRLEAYYSTSASSAMINCSSPTDSQESVGKGITMQMLKDRARGFCTKHLRVRLALSSLDLPRSSKNVIRKRSVQLKYSDCK